MQSSGVKDMNDIKEWDRLYNVDRNRGGYSVASMFYYNQVVKAGVIPKGVVDFGCGNGSGINDIRSKTGLKCIGVDLSPFVTKKNKQSYPNTEFVTLDLNDLNIPAALYEHCNVAMSVHALEHVQKAKEHIDLVLRYFDCYAIAVPYKTNWSCKYHLWIFDETSFKDYDIIHQEVFNNIDNIHTSLSNTILYILKGKTKMDEITKEKDAESPSLTTNDVVDLEDDIVIFDDGLNDVVHDVNEELEPAVVEPETKRKRGRPKKEEPKKDFEKELSVESAAVKTVSTGTPGRPWLASSQKQIVDVGGKSVPVEVLVPAKADIVVTDISVKTRKQIENPDTSDNTKKAFNHEYFSKCNFCKRHVKMLLDKKIQAQYITHFVSPAKVFVAGCAAGDELLAWQECGVPVVGQDIVRVAYPEVSDSVKIGEVYQVYDDSCDMIQLFDVFQYLEEDVLSALMRFLKETTSIKYLAVIINNKGYELQINGFTQHKFDQEMKNVFEKVNDIDDYILRAIDLVKDRPNYECYGLMPQSQKMLWIYKRIQ